MIGKSPKRRKKRVVWSPAAQVQRQRGEPRHRVFHDTWYKPEVTEYLRMALVPGETFVSLSGFAIETCHSDVIRQAYDNIYSIHSGAGQAIPPGMPLLYLGEGRETELMPRRGGLISVVKHKFLIGERIYYVLDLSYIRRLCDT